MCTNRKDLQSKTKPLDSIFFLRNFSLTLRQLMVKRVKAAGTLIVKLITRPMLILQVSELDERGALSSISHQNACSLPHTHASTAPSLSLCQTAVQAIFKNCQSVI